MIERLQQEHRDLTVLAASLRDGLRSLVPDLEALTRYRWELAKMMMQHLAFEDRNLYRPLEAHPDSAVAEVALRFKAHLTSTQADYEAHTAQWTGPAMKDDWRGYCSASIRQLRVLDERIQREEAELFPLISRLGEAPQVSLASTRNWARAALDVHTALGLK